MKSYCSAARHTMAEMDPCENYCIEMNPARGEWPSIPVEVERLLKEFVVDAMEIGVPCSKSKLAVDIQEYVRREKLVVAFTNEKPGTNGHLTISLKYVYLSF